MKTTIQATILASMLSAGMAMPALAIPEGPPSFVLGTEQAYSMTPLSAYLGATPTGLMLRNGMPGNWEWWLQNTTLNITPGFTVGTDLGAKVMFLNNAGSGLAGAFYGDLRPNYGATGTFGLGAEAGLSFSQSLVFGNLTIAPNVSAGSLTSGSIAPDLNLNLALVAPLGGGWLLMLEDVPSYGLNGAGFSNNAQLGGRFWPTKNAALDVTLLGLNGSTFSAGLLGLSGYVGF